MQSTDFGTRKGFQLEGEPEGLDGVLALNPTGKPIGFIRLPERCSNLEFGGPKRNGHNMTACHSQYALDVECHAAVESHAIV